ncbi:hypothetical protein C1S86_24910 [Vibrio parahaemolyticus]|uniref:Uncharacterized protein n=3 Tax=Vibrio TaxID=662 RepID=A0A1Y1BA32_VIBPH|nr:hypothetical protein [Vibrio parahaemolyticus]EGQ7796013.1 hypothetical protein [Vibrio parahaemolyticus]EGQ7811036.1 hypothetical protein [Vibrio parahaemolyticus]EHC7290901.1 hypothetical protein [Vibrio parahaemolyticus]EHR5480088.1 hypothetical protein [Vibrio parahaemolyticus]EJA7342169.1 hypothetical protein [Vibrio parahaemolyticus]
MYSLLDGYEGQLEAEVHVSKGYQGACKVILEGSWGKVYFAVLPCFYEAKRVMGLALNPHVGGFYGVTIVETNNDITHERAEDWLLEH